MKAKTVITNLNNSAWDKWVEYRVKNNLPEYKTNRVMARVCKMPKSKQRQCIQYSIDNAYQGLFPSKFQGQKIMRKDDGVYRSESRTKVVDGKTKPYKSIGLQFNRKEWDALSKLRRETKRSANSIIREGIDLMLTRSSSHDARSVEAKEPMTEKQKSFLRSLCCSLDVDFVAYENIDKYEAITEIDNLKKQLCESLDSNKKCGWWSRLFKAKH